MKTSQETEKQGFISAVVGELNRRKVLRTVGGYAVVVFVLLQLMDAAVEPLRLPEWVPTLVVIVIILGFPLVFLLAWLFDITSEGVCRTESAGLLSRAQSSVLFSIMLLSMGGLGYGFHSYYSGVFVAADPVSTFSQESARAFQAPQNSIAVLPFSDLSEQNDQEHFSDGIAEEILNLLTQVDGLHVAARTSSFAFRNPQKDIREIGRLLNVRTILEGSIRTAGNRVRMTAQLINVEDGYHIWSQTFDRDMDDIFAIQDQVAEAIASALVDSFDGLTSRPASRTDSMAAFEAYRTGRLHWWRRSPEELKKAIGLFAEALEKDATFAPAYAALADSWLLLSQYGNISLAKAVERSQPLIEKALELDAESEEAFAALGLARWQIGQMDSAESAFRQAIRLNGDYIPARHWLGGLLGDLGRLPEQSLVLEEAMRLDPLNELLAINYAGNLFIRGEPSAAREMLDQLIDLRPDSTGLLRTSSAFASANGDLVTGWNLAWRAYDLEPASPVVIATMSQAWLDLGNTDEAERVLVSGLETAAENLSLRMNFFFLLLVQGRIEEAEALVRETSGDSPEALPKQIQDYVHYQYGLIALARGDAALAQQELESSIRQEVARGYDGQQLMVLTMASLAHLMAGDEERAEERLLAAERTLRRARLNGVDDPDFYYTQSGIHALRGKPQEAVTALRAAYDRGFRQHWVLVFDKRLDPIRSDPEFVALAQLILDDVNRARVAIENRQVAMSW
jgi:TolB-like protein/tetratricopeptide (TPR) repeat protein